MKLTTSGTPATVAAGTSYTLTLTPSTKAAGGPAYHHPVLTTTLPAGEKFTATPTSTGWSCVLSNSTRTLTCTSTTTTPIAAGTSLKPVVAAVVIVTGVTGTLVSTTTLSDLGDSAMTVSVSTTVNVTPDPSPEAHDLRDAGGGAFGDQLHTHPHLSDERYRRSRLSRSQVDGDPPGR